MLGYCSKAPRGSFYSLKEPRSRWLLHKQTLSAGAPNSPVHQQKSYHQWSANDLIGQLPFLVRHRIVRCPTRQLPRQLAIGGRRPPTERAIGALVRCTGQCIVHCPVNFIIKILESRELGRTQHQTIRCTTDSLVGPSLAQVWLF